MWLDLESAPVFVPEWFMAGEVSDRSDRSTFQIQPHFNPALKMEPTEGSETSVFENWTPGRYPKEANLHSRHGESLRTKNIIMKFSVFKRYGTVCIGMLYLHFEGAYEHIFQVIRRRFYGTLLFTLLLSKV